MTRLRTDDQLCFAVYDASRALTGRYRAGLEAVGLTYTQYVVMMRLWEHSPQTLTTLGEALHLDSGTLSPLLKRLEAQGFVTRRRPPEDERTVELTLTPAGRDLQDQAQRVQADVEAATGLDPAALAALREDLHALAARLRDYDDEVTA